MTTTWKPDTCECEIRFKDAEEFENGTPEVVKRCEGHKNIPIENLFSRVRAENRAKNLARETVIQELKPDVMVNFSWSFDDQRNLQVSFKRMAISAQLKSQIEYLRGSPLDGMDIDVENEERLRIGFGVEIGDIAPNKKDDLKTKLKDKFKDISVNIK